MIPARDRSCSGLRSRPYERCNSRDISHCETLSASLSVICILFQLEDSEVPSNTKLCRPSCFLGHRYSAHELFDRQPRKTQQNSRSEDKGAGDAVGSGGLQEGIR